MTYVKREEGKKLPFALDTYHRGLRGCHRPRQEGSPDTEPIRLQSRCRHRGGHYDSWQVNIRLPRLPRPPIPLFRDGLGKRDPHPVSDLTISPAVLCHRCTLAAASIRFIMVTSAAPKLLRILLVTIVLCWFQVPAHRINRTILSWLRLKIAWQCAGS